MTDQGFFEEYTGVTDAEVQGLCERYGMDLAEAGNWYDGYRFPEFQHVYNPKSVAGGHACAEGIGEAGVWDVINGGFILSGNGIKIKRKSGCEGGEIMLDSKGFDLWADGYDKSVGLSDEDGTYPFAGYKQILNEIYNRVLTGKGKSVLDIGFGTGALTARLYEQGCNIWGQDFSERMTELAKDKMNGAKLYQGDFSEGLVEELKQNRYDAIIATYSLHHLTDGQKVKLIKSLLPLLNDGGCVYIGDVAFKTRAEMESCRALTGDEWDDEEFYFVIDELAEAFPHMKFEQFSFCAGLLSFEG